MEIRPSWGQILAVVGIWGSNLAVRGDFRGQNLRVGGRYLGATALSLPVLGEK